MACGVLLLGTSAGTTAGSADDGRVADFRIKVESLSPPRLVIEGELVLPSQTWSFRKTYAGLLSLGDRIENLTLSDSKGTSVEVKRLAPGEYRAAAPASRFRYEVKLDPPARSEDAAYVSWLTPDRGVLMPGDLLPALTATPRLGQKVLLSFELPEQWLVSSVEKSISRTQFSVSDPDTAVFFTSRDLQLRTVQVKGMELIFATSGQWAVSPDEIMAMAKRIVETHADTWGGVPGERALVILSPFPKPESPQRWSAETRGRTVFLLAGLQPAKTAALVQLSLPLTHEIFHLWVPNGLALEGDYDWFYEGFTIYQAMRAAQRLNLLTVQDLLNAVGRAVDTYSPTATGSSLSLIDASQRRWTTNPALIYQKAMVVAFLYDLTVRIQTGNKRSLENVYAEIFRRHRAGLPTAQGNEAVIEALSQLPGMEDFASRYIKTPVRLDVLNLLARFGLRVESFGMRTRISVSPNLNREQRDLWRRLGYNSETRGSGNNH